MSPPLLELKELSLSLGARPLLDRIHLTLSAGERLALIGNNGVGKSTLIRAILGMIPFDSGTLRCNKEVGYLPQEWPKSWHPEGTVRHFLDEQLASLPQIGHEMSALEEAMAAGQAVDLERYGALQEEYEQHGGYLAGHWIDRVVQGLDLAEIDQERPVATLSGGEQSRLLLAGLLLRSPRLLILDEPTNHLDFAAIEWLEGYLESYSGALLVVSHDRYFLDKTVNRIAELSSERAGLRLYVGNYQSYLNERERIYQSELERYETWRSEMADLRRQIKGMSSNQRKLKRATDSNRLAYNRHGELAEKGQSTRLGQLRNRLDALEKSPLSPPTKGWEIGYRFTTQELISERVVELKEVAKEGLFEGVSATVSKGERIVLTGPNGSGKSTLLNMIAGLLPPSHGSISIAPTAVVGYLDQMQRQIQEGQRVIDSYGAVRSGSESELRSELHKVGLFAGEEPFQLIGNLSSGQKQKLQLARCIAMGANLLLLDEPTNHLDLESIEKLERALLSASITLIAVSHDRRFVEKIATKEWHLEKGRLIA